MNTLSWPKGLWQAAAITLLSGCGQAGQDDGPPPAPPSPEIVTGVFEATLPSGKKVRHTLAEDGSYSEQDLEGNPVEAGTWRLVGEQICYDPEGSEPEACFEGGPSTSVVRQEPENTGD